MNRESLFHRVNSQRWQQLVEIQCVCRALIRFSGRHWKLKAFAGWQDIYKEYRSRLKDLDRIDIQELNTYITNTNLDISSYKIRDIIEMERMPLKTVE